MAWPCARSRLPLEDSWSWPTQQPPATCALVPVACSLEASRWTSGVAGKRAWAWRYERACNDCWQPRLCHSASAEAFFSAALALLPLLRAGAVCPVWRLRNLRLPRLWPCRLLARFSGCQTADGVPAFCFCFSSSLVQVLCCRARSMYAYILRRTCVMCHVCVSWRGAWTRAQCAAHHSGVCIIQCTDAR
jgi:hypothetical protein